MCLLTRSRLLLCAFDFQQNIRNIAVIAHVDHGKTTLVDAMLKQSGTVSNARNRLMDSMAQEKERGITILAKHTGILYKENRINVVDTPGHMDFGGEVERALQMVEGFLLLVDAHEGVKPGTRFVLRKALSLRLKPLIVLNKIDMDEADCEKTEEAITDLFLDTVADSDQLNLTFLYGSGRDGYVNRTPTKGGTMQPLFDAIMELIPPPKQKQEQNHLRMLVGNVDEYMDGTQSIKVAIGRIFSGSLAVKNTVQVVRGDERENALVKKIQLFKGVEKIDVQEASFGDMAIVHMQQPKDKNVPVLIGATVCKPEKVDPWPWIPPDEPSFMVLITEMASSWKTLEISNKNGSHLGIIRERLRREALNNTALRVTDKGLVRGIPCIEMAGRGLLHLGVILEDMRREDFEFELLAPETVTKIIDGEVHEPWERVIFDYAPQHSNSIMQLLTKHHADIGETNVLAGDRLQTDTLMAVRLMGDIGQTFMRMTGGDGVVQRESAGYRKMITGVDAERSTGALVSVDSGTVTDYSLSQSAQHGTYFVQTGEQVYFGQVVGECGKLRNQDMPINITKAKELLNIRANAVDASKRSSGGARTSSKSLEEALTWINAGELVSVTPQSVRIRKIHFDGKTSRSKK